MTVTVNHAAIDCTHPTKHKGIFGRLADMIAVRQQRRSLMKLDAHLLRDIGITHKTAMVEAKKPVWDVPAHWSK